MDILDIRAQQLEAGLQRAADHVGGVGVPAGADILMIRGAHDGGRNGRVLSLRAVHLHPDLDAVARAEVGELAQATRYVLDGGFGGNLFGQPVGADADRHGARVPRQQDPLLAALDILLPHLRVDCLELADRAVAQQAQLTGFELLAHRRALPLAQGRLHSVLMRGPQLDSLEAEAGKSLYDLVQIPIRQHVVGCGAEMEAGSPSALRRRARREHSAAADCRPTHETAPPKAHSSPSLV